MRNGLYMALWDACDNFSWRFTITFVHQNSEEVWIPFVSAAYGEEACLKLRDTIRRDRFECADDDEANICTQPIMVHTIEDVILVMNLCDQYDMLLGGTSDNGAYPKDLSNGAGSKRHSCFKCSKRYHSSHALKRHIKSKHV